MFKKGAKKGQKVKTFIFLWLKINVVYFLFMLI
nr:MAG TPA: hypothetical protein [Caudoviricetes sp.]